MKSKESWYKLNDTHKIDTPAILLYPERIKKNISRMLQIAGDPARLWSHVKTHKTIELVRMQVAMGITKFKCATIAEAEMTALGGGKEILIAFPLIGNAIDRFIKLTIAYSEANFALLADSEIGIREISNKALDSGLKIKVWLDIDIGMGRTGVLPTEAFVLYRLIYKLENLEVQGLHCYDGHVHNDDLNERKAACYKAFEPLNGLVTAITNSGMDKPDVIAGGTPTFQILAEATVYYLSPGTSVLWDYGYDSFHNDLGFLCSAVLLTEIVSKPDANKLCLNLGHKAVSSEMQQPRVYFPELGEVEMIIHSEEHMVIKTDQADMWQVGDCLYGIPTHICPTMALHENANIVNNSVVTEEWNVIARKRKINY